MKKLTKLLLSITLMFSVSTAVMAHTNTDVYAKKTENTKTTKKTESLDKRYLNELKEKSAKDTERSAIYDAYRKGREDEKEHNRKDFERQYNIYSRMVDRKEKEQRETRRKHNLIKFAIFTVVVCVGAVSFIFYLKGHKK